MLEKSADDAEDADIFAQPGNLWPQTTNAADDQIDLHAGAGSFVEFLDDLLIHERVEFHDDAAGSPGQGVIALALDQCGQRVFQIERRDEQFFHAGITGEPGEGVEDDRDFLGDLRIGGQQTEVGVDARRARVVIAGAEMHIMPEPIGIAADDEQRFAMRLQTDHAINDMRARFLEAPRPLNVGRLVEARPQVRPAP